MGLFDHLGTAMGKGGAFSGFLTSALASQLPARLSAALAVSPYGNVDGLLDRFREGGFGAEVESWLGAEANLPVTSEQIMEVIDPMTMGDLASALGVPAAMLPGLIAQYLPVLVDKLSPNGVVEMPQG
ncbi:YidB family protein [Aquabacter sp. CN5-332]|uniref:YidB family protein n=1 Tax=Aquabacter sp. CN5-332 TaxID=3156608 RepID=UPI0032B35B4C